MLGDIRHAFRLLRRNPAFSLVACLTLAIGLGATTVVFSVLDAALFRPLPLQGPRSTRRCLGGSPDEKRGDECCLRRPASTWSACARSSRCSTGSRRSGTPGRRCSRPDSDLAPWVGAFTPSFTRLLGIAPQLGRGFAAGRRSLGRRDSHQRQLLAARVRRRQGRDRQNHRLHRPNLRRRWRHAADLQVLRGRARRRVAPDRRERRRVPRGRLRTGISVERAQRELNTALAHSGGPTGRFELSVAGWDRGSAVRAGGNRTSSVRTMLFSLFGAVGSSC